MMGSPSTKRNRQRFIYEPPMQAYKQTARSWRKRRADSNKTNSREKMCVLTLQKRAVREKNERVPRESLQRLAELLRLIDPREKTPTERVQPKGENLLPTTLHEESTHCKNAPATLPQVFIMPFERPSTVRLLHPHMELWVTTSNVNLGKLVPLEVHRRLESTKIAKKYFPMSEWGVLYIVEKLKRRSFQQAKEHTNQIPN